MTTRGTAAEAQDGVGAKVKKSAQRAGKAAGKQADAMRVRAESTVATANRIITEHPIAAAAAAVVIGAAASYLFPRTARSIGKVAPALAASVARAVMDAAQAAQDAMPERETITKPVGAAADKVTRAARQAPDAVKSAARSGIDAARSGMDAARDAVSRTGLADQASALLDRASEGAAKAATRIRNSVGS